MAEREAEHVLVAQYFHPDTASTGQLMTDLAVGLQNRGLDMKVYTTQPNYHSGEFEKQPRRETHEGVDIRRIRAPQLRQTSLVRRGFSWLVYTVWMAAVLLLSRPDRQRNVIFVSNPPFFGIAMWVVCQFRGWDYTYVVYDLWPEKGVEFGFYKKNGIIDQFWTFFHTKVFRAAERIVTLGPKMKSEIVSYAPSQLSEKTTIIHNWAEADFITPKDKTDNWFSEEHDLVDNFTLLYSGNIGLFHDLETAIRGIAASDSEVVKLLIIGEGDNKASMVELADLLDLSSDTVEFLPYQSRENLPYSLTCADVALVTVHEGFEGTCVSSKLYTALASGQPVLVIAQPDSDEVHVVERYNAGQQVEQGNVSGIVEAIERWQSDSELLARQSENARTAFENHFTKQKSVDKYYEVLTEEMTSG